MTGKEMGKRREQALSMRACGPAGFPKKLCGQNSPSAIQSKGCCFEILDYFGFASRCSFIVERGELSELPLRHYPR